MVKEARSIIKGIQEHQKNTSSKVANIQKQVEDLSKAQRLLTESVQMGPVATSGGDSKLKSFIQDDGKIQLGTKRKNVHINGHGSVQTEVEGLLTAKVPCNEWHRELIKLTQERAWCRSLMSNPSTPKTDLKIYKHIQKAPSEIKGQVTKAFYDSAGVGAEFIPDQFRAELYETYQTPRGLRALLPSIEMQNNTLLIPRIDRGGRPYIKGQVTSDSPSNYSASTISTAQTSVAVKGFATRYVVDDAAAEDSALALMPILNRQISADLEDAWEDCWVNGDTTATHGDTGLANWNIRSRWGASGLGTSNDHRRAFMGLRHRALDVGTGAASGGTLSIAELVSRIASMGELGSSDIVLIASPETMIKHLMGNSSLLTVDSFGPNATLLRGQVASIFGFPVVLSRFVSADLNGSGVYDNVTKNTSGLLLYNTGSFAQYQKRGITVETDKDISSGSIEIVSTMRNIAATADSATTKNCAYLYNLSA